METNTLTSNAAMATDLKGAEIRSQISMQVIKQIRNQGQQQAQALLKMMQQSNAAVNGHIDIYA